MPKSVLTMEEIRAGFARIRELEKLRDNYRAEAKTCQDQIDGVLTVMADNVLNDRRQIDAFEQKGKGKGKKPKVAEAGAADGE